MNLIYLNDMKKSWIIIIIVFLLASNLALLATLIFSKNDNNISKEIWKENRINKPHDLSFTAAIAKELNMSPEQVEQLKSLSNKFHDNKKELGRQMADIKHSYFSHLATESPDETYLKNLADSLGKLLAEKMLLDFNHYQNIKSICTPEQVEKFDSLGKNHIHYRNNKKLS